MINRFFVNSLDMVNIIYLWAVLTKKNNNIFKLLYSVFITSVLTTFIEQLELNFIITYIVTIMIIKIIYERTLKDLVLEFFLVLLIEMSLQLIFSLITDKFIDNYTIKMIIVELITLISIIIFSKINLSKNITFKKLNSSILIYFILTCSMYAIVFKTVWNYEKGVILNNLSITSVILSILVISKILTYVYTIKELKEKEKLKILNEYNTVFDEIVQEIKQRQHDFINYKNTIRGIVEVSDEKEVKQAITNYINDEDKCDKTINELIYINNIVIKSIIYRNICRAKKYNINLQYEIENDVLDHILNYHEISNLLGNLLNNAFEEVMKNECTKKNIKIKILTQNKTSHLIIKNQLVNSNDINLNKMFKKGYSTKSVSSRGYGLHNVKQIVNFHKGYIKIKVESTEIIFDIYFNKSAG
ncbi:GHKL domain-containing protein [Clostridium botulinum]|nr:GHKL domain-containing protein [Clostridium botulinum]